MKLLERIDPLKAAEKRTPVLRFTAEVFLFYLFVALSAGLIAIIVAAGVSLERTMDKIVQANVQMAEKLDQISQGFDQHE